MGFLNLLYPPYARCFCCGCPRLDGVGDHLCKTCRKELADMERHGIPFYAEGVEKVYAPYPYEGAAKELIHCLKYRCVRDAAKTLGSKMAQSLEEYDFHALVPVPLHGSRLAERGFNQAELLAASVFSQTKMPVLLALERLRETGQQARLEKERRFLNMADAFKTCEHVRGKRLLLVDDVCTTGATARACAGALYRSGAKNVSLLVAAVTLKTGLG